MSYTSVKCDPSQISITSSQALYYQVVFLILFLCFCFSTAVVVVVVVVVILLGGGRVEIVRLIVTREFSTKTSLAKLLSVRQVTDSSFSRRVIIILIAKT